MSCLIDTNVLVYSAVSEAPLHDTARRRLLALLNEGEDLFLTAQVIREYVSVVTRGGVLRHPRAILDAIRDVRSFLDVFRLLPDPSDVMEVWMDIVSTTQVTGPAVHDAFLVATAIGNGVDAILTHNVRHIERFPQVRVVPLLAS